MQGKQIALSQINMDLNACATRGARASLLLDFIAGLALRVAEAVAGGHQKFGSGEWIGKWKAYQQMAVHPDHRHLAVLFFPQQRWFS